MTGFFLSACKYSIKRISNKPLNVQFDSEKWRKLIKVNIRELENDCKNSGYSFDQSLVEIDSIIPGWNNSDITTAADSISDTFKDGTLCLISLENKGEIYNSKVGIFWLKGKECHGMTWVNKKIKKIKRSKFAYKKIKKMSTICKPHLISPGSKMIFTEINGDDIWVKIIIEPSLEQENKFYDFLIDE